MIILNKRGTVWFHVETGPFSRAIELSRNAIKRDRWTRPVRHYSWKKTSNDWLSRAWQRFTLHRRKLTFSRLNSFHNSFSNNYTHKRMQTLNESEKNLAKLLTKDNINNIYIYIFFSFHSLNDFVYHIEKKSNENEIYTTRLKRHLLFPFDYTLQSSDNRFRESKFRWIARNYLQFTFCVH